MSNYTYRPNFSFGDYLVARHLVGKLEQSYERETKKVTKAVSGLSEGIAEGLSEVTGRLGDLERGIQNLDATLDWGFHHLAEKVTRVSDAIDELVKVARQPTQIQALERFDIARDCFRRGLYQEALDQLKLAITGYPVEWRFHFLQGTIYLGFAGCDFNLINPSDARSAFLKAARYAQADDPEDASRAYLSAGWASYCLGEFQDGAKYYAKALELNPPALEAEFQLAKISMAANHVEEGWKYLQSVSEKDPRYLNKIDDDEDFGSRKDTLHPLLESWKTVTSALLKDLIRAQQAKYEDMVQIWKCAFTHPYIVEQIQSRSDFWTNVLATDVDSVWELCDVVDALQLLKTDGYLGSFKPLWIKFSPTENKEIFIGTKRKKIGKEFIGDNGTSLQDKTSWKRPIAVTLATFACLYYFLGPLLSFLIGFCAGILARGKDLTRAEKDNQGLEQRDVTLTIHTTKIQTYSVSIYDEKRSLLKFNVSDIATLPGNGGPLGAIYTAQGRLPDVLPPGIQLQDISTENKHPSEWLNHGDFAPAQQTLTPSEVKSLGVATGSYSFLGRTGEQIASAREIQTVTEKLNLRLGFCRLGIPTKENLRQEKYRKVLDGIGDAFRFDQPERDQANFKTQMRAAGFDDFPDTYYNMEAQSDGDDVDQRKRIRLLVTKPAVIRDEVLKRHWNWFFESTEKDRKLMALVQKYYPAIKTSHRYSAMKTDEDWVIARNGTTPASSPFTESGSATIADEEEQRGGRRGDDENSDPALLRRSGGNPLEDSALNNLNPKMMDEEKLFTPVTNWGEYDTFHGDPYMLDTITREMLTKKPEGDGYYFAWDYIGPEILEPKYKNSKEAMPTPTLIVTRKAAWKVLQNIGF